jgi:hypothetical protein
MALMARYAFVVASGGRNSILFSAGVSAYTEEGSHWSLEAGDEALVAYRGRVRDPQKSRRVTEDAADIVDGERREIVWFAALAVKGGLSILRKELVEVHPRPSLSRNWLGHECCSHPHLTREVLGKVLDRLRGVAHGSWRAWHDFKLDLACLSALMMVISYMDTDILKHLDEGASVVI